MSKKKASDKPPAEKPKRSHRMVRIPEAFAVQLERLADRKFSDYTEELRIAVREYLERHNMMPPPASAD